MAFQLIEDGNGFFHLLADAGFDVRFDGGVGGIKGDFALRFADFSNDFLLETAKLFDGVEAKHDGIEHFFFGDLPCAGFNHHNRFFRTSDGEINIRKMTLFFCGVDDEFAIHAANINSSNRSIEGDVRGAKGKGGAEKPRHFRGIIGIHRHYGSDDLNFVAESVRE